MFNIKLLTKNTNEKKFAFKTSYFAVKLILYHTLNTEYLTSNTDDH